MSKMIFKSLSLPLSEFVTNWLMENKTEQSVLFFFISKKVLIFWIFLVPATRATFLLPLQQEGCLGRSDNANNCPWQISSVK